MFSRTRKPQSIDSSSVNDSFDSLSSNTSAPNHIIPPNKGSKKYTMNEVFQVWFDTKDAILSGKTLPVNQGENYKLVNPTQIYHLDLQYKDISSGAGSQDASADTYGGDLDVVGGSDENGATKSFLPAVDSSLSNLSLDDVAANGDHIDANSNSSHKMPPPGMFSKESPGKSVPIGVNVITPDKIEWIYIDPTGNEQGPFNGDMMQEWLTEGYLNFDLRIRRKQEHNYQTLKEFCDRVQNYVQPFKIPLPDLSEPEAFQKVPHLQRQQQPVQSQPIGENGANSIVSNGHDLLFSQPLSNQSLHHQLSAQSLSNQNLSGQPIQQQQSQFHQFVSNVPGNLGAANMRLNSTINSQSNLFGNDFINDPFAPSSAAFNGGNQFSVDPMNHSNIGGFNNLQHHINPMPSILQHQIQAQNQQPSLSRTSSGWGSSLDSPSNLIGNTAGSSVSVPQVLSQLISQPAPMSPWSTGVQSLSRVSSPFIPTSNLNTSSGSDGNALPDISRKDSVLDELHTSVVTDILNDGEEDHFKQQAEQNVAAVPFTESVKPQEQQETQQQTTTQEPVIENSPQKPRQQSVVSAQVQVHDLRPATPTQQKLAPWAVSKAESEKPALTLKEIQKLEAEKLEKQRQLEAQIRAEQAAKLWATEAQVTEAVPDLPKTAGWATTTTPVIPPKKTLAEIQKEEAADAAAKAKAAKASASINATPALKSTFASALASSTPKDNGSWVTVATKKQPVNKKLTSQPIITNTTSNSNASPQLLRSVSAARTSSSTVNTNAIRAEFLIWARSAMTNLYPSVSKDDLLDMFITLPSNSADSSQLISETIYSSSATMDGRRYAQEFMKKRQQVDKQIGTSSDLDWSAAIAASADMTSSVDEDGWSTSVKPKKKGKKF